MTIILGLIAMVGVGAVLGLLGGGGSILTVPILVYLMQLESSLATGYSLVIVGAASLWGAVTYYRRGDIDLQAGCIFAIPSTLATFAMRISVVRHIPAEWHLGGGLAIPKQAGMLIIFAVIMLASARSLIKGQPPTTSARQVSEPRGFRVAKALLAGFVVGCLTGFVGVGGGFMLIPALCLILDMPMKRAVGTSLMIIAINSVVGCIGDAIAAPHYDWVLLIKLSALAIVGMIIGSKLNRVVPPAKLKPLFGYSVVVMACIILVKEIVWH